MSRKPTGYYNDTGEEIYTGDVINTIYKQWRVVEQNGVFVLGMKKNPPTMEYLKQLGDEYDYKPFKKVKNHE